jgi:hypothetical protein
MVTNGEKALRLGCYAGLAAVKLGDLSFARWFEGRNIRDVTDEEFRKFTGEIHVRLLLAGHIQPDEDPFDDMYRELVAQLGECEVSEMLKCD